MRIRITHVTEWVRDNRAMSVGDVYDVAQHGFGTSNKYGYLIWCKNGRSIVVYQDECEVVVGN